MQNLYNSVDTFKLVIPALSIDMAISEPIDYDKAKITLKRDRVYYGVSYEFFDNTINVKFELDNGIVYLRQAFAAYGSDAVAKLQHYYFNESTGLNELLFEGNLNFNTYIDDGITVSCEIEKVSFENLLRTRFDTKVSMIDTLSLDGEASNMIQSVPVNLHSKEILRRFITNCVKPYVDSNTYDDYVAFENDPSNPQWDNNTLINVYFTHDFATGLIINDNMSEFSGLPFSANGQSDPKGARIQLNAKEDGTWDIYVSILLQFWSKDFFDIAAYEAQSVITTYLDIYDKDGALKLHHTIGGQTLGTWGDGMAKTHNKSAVIDNVSINKGDVIYIYSHLIYQLTAGVTYDYSLTGITFRIYQYNNSLSVDATTTAPSTLVTTYRLRETLRKCISMTTGVNNALQSDFFNKEGFYFSTTNGMIIRGETATDEPVKVSLKEAIETAHAIWNLGVLIKDNKVYIEPFEWFFQDRLILAISDISDFTEETANELLFNELEIGYEKTAIEDLQTLDEFNIKHSKLLPIKTFKEKKTKLSKMMGSGYALELQRRLQFSESENKGGKYDNDLFIISLSRVVTMAAEKDDYMTILNIISPKTTYNARISPQRMAIKWKSYIDSISAFKLETDKTQTTFAGSNRNSRMSLEWLPGASYPVEIASGDPVVENDSLFVKNDLKVFYPVYHKFKTRLSFNDFKTLKLALTASYGHIKDNGYITYPDFNGIIQSGFVYDLVYLPMSEQAEFTCLKKY